MILFTCFVHCLFPFLECEVPEGRTFCISWDMGRASATYCNFPLENPWPSSVCVFFRKWKLPCVSVWKHVQTQPKPNSTFHRLARQKGVVLCTRRHAYQDKCDLILGLLFELFHCLKPERMWGPNLLLPIYPHTEFIRLDGRQSSETKERGFWWDNAALNPEVFNSAQPWRFYWHGPIHIFLKTNWILIGNLDKPEKYKVLWS